MEDYTNKKLILASKSPRRIELLKAHGYDPIVLPADVNENIPFYHEMEETVMYISLKKAQATRAIWEAQQSTGKEGQPADNSEPAAQSTSPALILAADTIVYKDGEIMGKPKDKADGFRMLAMLRGTYHYVATGVTIIDTAKGVTNVFCDVTKVHFKYYTDEELNAYLDTPEAYDKAGGYAIQGAFGQYIERFEGDFENVMGLPTYRVKPLLDEKEGQK